MKKLASLLLVLFMLSLIPAFAFADSDITVSGAGEVLVPADTAVVSLGVTAADPDVLEAMASVNMAIASVREALISAGVDESDINTDYISIYARYDYSGETEKIVGYNANSTLAVRVNDIDLVGKIIDTALEAGANTLNDISFSATDTKEAKEKAMRLAVEDARAKAEIYADAAGLSIFGIEDIVEQGTFSSEKGVSTMFNSVEAAGDTETFVQAAKLTVSSRVTITFKADR